MQLRGSKKKILYSILGFLLLFTSSLWGNVRADEALKDVEMVVMLDDAHKDIQVQLYDVTSSLMKFPKDINESTEEHLRRYVTEVEKATIDKSQWHSAISEGAAVMYDGNIHLHVPLAKGYYLLIDKNAEVAPTRMGAMIIKQPLRDENGEIMQLLELFPKFEKNPILPDTNEPPQEPKVPSVMNGALYFYKHGLTVTGQDEGALAGAEFIFGKRKDGKNVYLDLAGNWGEKENALVLSSKEGTGAVSIRGYPLELGEYFFEETQTASFEYDLSDDVKHINVSIKSPEDIYIDGQKMGEELIIFNQKLKRRGLLPITSAIPREMLPSTGEEWTIFLTLLGYDVLIYTLIIFELRHQSRLNRRRQAAKNVSYFMEEKEETNG